MSLCLIKCCFKKDLHKKMKIENNIINCSVIPKISGLDSATSGGQLTHPEGQNEDKYEESLKENQKNYRNLR